MNFIIDPLIKLGFKMITTFATERIIAIGIVALLEKLAKRTKNTIDDKMIEAWKQELIKNGLKL